MTSSLNRTSGTWLIVIGTIYLVSFLLPTQTGDCFNGNGLELFLLGGWLCLTVTGLPWGWPWLANLVFYYGLRRLACGDVQVARWAGRLATGLAAGP
jgi:hypothetical protein